MLVSSTNTTLSRLVFVKKKKLSKITSYLCFKKKCRQNIVFWNGDDKGIDPFFVTKIDNVVDVVESIVSFFVQFV